MLACLAESRLRSTYVNGSIFEIYLKDREYFLIFQIFPLVFNLFPVDFLATFNFIHYICTVAC